MNSEEQAQHLYEVILRTANHFLRNSHFEIHILQKHRPTYAELAAMMRQLAHIVHELADDFDPMLAQKAIDYVGIMEKMAIAIVNEDEGDIVISGVCTD